MEKDRQLLHIFFQGCAQWLLFFQDDGCFKTLMKLEGYMAVNIIS